MPCSSQEITQLHLMMGSQCNARCIMCYQRRFSAKDNMPAVIYRKHLSLLYPGLKHIMIQGGEPTIMPNCKDFALCIRDFPNLKISLLTNGINIDDFWLETILVQGEGINFSLNAANRSVYDKIVKYGNYGRVIKNIGEVINRRTHKIPAVSISMVVLRHNIDQITDFIALGCEMGVDMVIFLTDPELSFRGAGPKDKIRKKVSESLALSDKAGIKIKGLNVIARYCGHPWGIGQYRKETEECPAPFDNLMVDQLGDVRVCCNTWRIIGNTYKSSLKDILKHRERKIFQDKIEGGDYSWCHPQCPENQEPTKQALPAKYYYMATKDFKRFFTTVVYKIAKLARLLAVNKP